MNRYNQSGGAIMDDFDGDGRLDLAVTCNDITQVDVVLPQRRRRPIRRSAANRPESPTNLAGWSATRPTTTTTAISTSSSLAAHGFRTPSGPTLLRNNGDGGFTDVTRESGLLDPVNSNAAAWADYDNDGWVDLFVACERQPNRLYRNRGNGTFEEVAAKAGVDENMEKFCKGCTWIDFDNDRYPRPVHQRPARESPALPEQRRRHVQERDRRARHRRAVDGLSLLGV